MELSRQAPLTALIIAGLLAGCSAGSAGQPPSTARASAAAAGSQPTRAAAPTGSATPRAARRREPALTASPVSLPVAPGAGARPQTSAFPSTASAAFRHAMADLWLAVTTGNPRFGLPAFFPEAAYKQVKAHPVPCR